jgi:putative membrane protein
VVSWSHWHTGPLLIGGILAIGWIYSLLTGPMRGLFTRLHSFPTREAFNFTIGLATFYLAVGSPLDSLGKTFLFSAHVLQLNVLMYVSPLFIVLGIPDWLVDTPARKSKTFRAIFRILVHPVVAGILFTLTISVWHFPFIFESAIKYRPIRSLEHLTIYISSILIWWSIASRSKRFPPLQYGIQILFFFALMIAQIPLVGCLTYAPSILYTTYADSMRILPTLNPLGDQMMGGFIMKLTNLVISLIVIGRAFYKWSKDSAKTILPAKQLKTH